MNRLMASLFIILIIIMLAENGHFPGAATGAAPAAVAAEQGTAPQPVLLSMAVADTAGGTQSPPPFAPVLVTVPDGGVAPASSPTLDELRGKIIFFTNRGGPYTELYRMNPDGSDQRPCNCQSLYADIFFGETASATRAQFLYIKPADASQPDGTDSQIWQHDNTANRDTLVAGAAPGFPTVDYDPVFAPNGKQIAWVTEAHIFAEIYRYDFATGEVTLLTESHGEWSKHPSYSPDSTQLVYWQNAASADSRQVWRMNADGTAKLNLSHNTYRDWDPIWVK